MSADKVLIIFLLQNYMYPLHVVVYPGLTKAHQASCIFCRPLLSGRAENQRSGAHFYTTPYTAMVNFLWFRLSSWANKIKSASPLRADFLFSGKLLWKHTVA